ncbi:MAG TPA: type I DNA topoisomerase [Firmicutes bacterium]|nr:type I DNA topoisomerase [Bacillota bacterium]
MTKKLVIVESPTKAKTIKRYLGKNYVVKASVGHVIDLPKSQFGIDIENNFQPKYITIRGKGKILNELKTASKTASEVFLAADPDREGEAICWHLARVLGIPERKHCRVEFNEITKDAVKKAFQKPRPININKVDAQQARRILDRLVGYKISPLLWKKIKKGLSAGRVQSVALRLITEREQEIEQFKPVEYWSISLFLTPGLKKNMFEARFLGPEGEKRDLKTRQEVDKILEELQGRDFRVLSIAKKEKNRHPAPPFTTSSLQQEAARKLGFSSNKTMRIAQQLYEGIPLEKNKPEGLITYIRTDAVRVSEVALREVRELVKKNYGADYLSPSVRYFKGKKNAQEAHEAIRPTTVNNLPDKIKQYLTKDQYRLYKIIWERFVASQMAAAVLDTVKVDIKGGDYIFRATGATTRFLGFMSLYVEGEDILADKEEGPLPPLEEGQALKLIKIEPRQHFTQPPPRFTEAMLVKTLEEKGIGRPSTYAPIISTIQQRGYVTKEGKVFKPTELGFVVVDILKNYFKEIIDVNFTAQMEEKLDQVEEGDYPWLAVVKEFYGPFKDSLQRAETSINKIEIKDEVSEETCPQCGRNLVYKFGKFGKFLACPGFPECRYTKPILKEAGVNCPECGAPVVVRKNKKGKIFYGCSAYPDCKFISSQKPAGELCPRCQSYMVEKKKRNGYLWQCTNKECGYTVDPGVVKKA